MAYLFYTISFVSLIIATVLYATRSVWKPYAPPIPYITAPGTIPEPLYNFGSVVYSPITSFNRRFSYQPLPNSISFRDDAEAGFSSANFNLADNIEAGDSRRGLDEGGKSEIQRIMKSRGVTFDEARRMYIEERFGREGIAKDGRPMDRKAVMFDR
ncbi:hypothetical protein K431DRAFT_339940 [Polychaeton citri CBS 116435]|uniref:Uncharacterized protein n=1 Tax=Polychaeton citri CBS 116435 TaxID=1314669 RepID=A0A9P4UMI0_9PEZI|nr:hypothetical protein K431DRAFT_339940 [Polychaeton citri CBS 116435]